MAKKRATKTPVEIEPAEDGKVSLQLRLDAELHARLKVVTEMAGGISLNQLINGILWGAMENVVIGEGRRTSNGYVQIKQRPKCLFFGEAGERYTDDEEECLAQGGQVLRELKKGEFWFGLDFSGRGVVQ